MLEHHETRELPYRADQMYALVSDIERYPEFLPWIVGARIRRRIGETVWADVRVGYKFIRETFGSKVEFNSTERKIQVEYLDGPLKHLRNRWHFTRVGEDRCLVQFDVEFEFSTPLLQKLARMFFDEVIRRMVSAFEARAHKLYGGV